MSICKKKSVFEGETVKYERIRLERRERKGTKSTERSCRGNLKKSKKRKKKRQQLGKKKSHPAFQSGCGKSQTRELYLIWTGRMTENQAGREGGSQLHSAVCKLDKQLSEC